MIPIECDQLSDEWFAAKLGIPSASNFKLIITSDGKPSKSSISFAYRLAYERITGIPTETFVSYDMKRGIANEPIARSLYEFINDVEVKQIGLCYFDEKKKFSCSPDGLIGEDGGLEIKDAKPEIHIDRLFNGWSKKENYQQIQGNMFVTGRKWWDRMSHCVGLPTLINRYERDTKFCAALKIELDEFCETLDTIEARLRKLL